ncbi:MAG: rubredoxin [Methanomicrobiales archaeon]|nr:rubredoxin [Methanomicrobiales archaeon]
MEMYICTVCGYVYNPEVGDASQGVAPRTPFEKLSGTWKCPRCRAERSKFVKREG